MYWFWVMLVLLRSCPGEALFLGKSPFFINSSFNPFQTHLCFISFICFDKLELIAKQWQYLLKLSSAVSRYQFPLTVSDIDTKYMYSFFPMYPVKEGTCSPVLMGIIRSLTIQVSHPLLRNLSFDLAERMKNPLRNLFNVSYNPLYPPRSLWWQRIHTSLTIDKITFYLFVPQELFDV